MAKDKTDKKEEVIVPRNWASYVETTTEAELNAWKQKHFDFFKYLNYYTGNHYTYYDTKTGNVVNNAQGVTIPLSYAVIRGVTNNIIKLRPKWQFYPRSGDTDSSKNLLKLSKLMDKLYDELEIENLLREVVKNGLLYSAAPVFVGWDQNKNNGKGGLVLEVEDNFTLLPDHSATNKSKLKHIVRIVKRRLADVREDEHYDKMLTSMLTAESKLGATPIHESIISKVNKINSSKDSDKNSKDGDVFIKEMYVKEWVDVEYEDITDKPRTKKVPRIRLICVAQGHVLYNEITDLEDFPFEWYWSDKNSMSFYGEGWMKNLISLNNSINRLETIKLNYADRMLQGSFIVQKGSKLVPGTTDGIKTYTVDGKYQPDVVKQMDLKPLPSTIDSSIANFQRYMQDIGGMQDVMMGRSPGANIANAAIESLIQEGANTTIELKQNLQKFLTNLTNQILWNIAKYQIAGEELVMDDSEAEGGFSTMRYISQESPIVLNLQSDDEASSSDMLQIGTDNRFKITIESEIAETQGARQEIAEKLFSIINPADGMPAIPLETLLEVYKFGNVKDILEKREVDVQKAREMQAQQQAQEAQMEVSKEEQKQEVSSRLNTSINYKDAPEDIKRQLEEQAGLQASQDIPVEPTTVNPMDEYGEQVRLRKLMQEKIMEQMAMQRQNQAQSVEDMA